METLLKDPVVIGSVGVIFCGLIGFVWVLSQLMKSAKPAQAPQATEDSLVTFPDLPPPNDLPLPVHVHEPEPVNKAMAEKLTLMTQRLADMQVQLNRQTAALTTATSAALSPETLDKMISAVNVVIQQVDTVQKSLDPAAVHREPPVEASSPAAAFHAAPAQPRPVAEPTPVVPVSEIISKQNPSA